MGCCCTEAVNYLLRYRYSTQEPAFFQQGSGAFAEYRSAYICDQSFSGMKINKNKYRFKLADLLDVIRISTSNIPHDFKENKKTKKNVEKYDGSVLNQEHRAVVYASRTLSSAERNYMVTEREYLTLIWTLNMFRTFLGSLPVKVMTYHAALTKLTNGKNLSSRMIRWVLKLAEFKIEWEHQPGTRNVVADVLSRNPVESIAGENVTWTIIRDLVLSSREQLIEEQRMDPQLGHIYR
ncbi:retrovirus-related Pol polyprotein from transposon opus [Trichonephila clavipes]|nr:retrovirus-related Pol polyprotein from transposon opus [Trichonephila clavipes]